MSKSFASQLKAAGLGDKAVQTLVDNEFESEQELRSFLTRAGSDGYNRLVAMGMTAKSADLVIEKYGPEQGATQVAVPSKIELVDPDNQCPHCQSRLSQQEKQANRCGACGKVLWEEIECPYCGNRQQLKGDLPRCLSCLRLITKDSVERRRLAYLRSTGVSANVVNNELADIMKDDIRRTAMDKAIEEGGSAARRGRGF